MDDEFMCESYGESSQIFHRSYTDKLQKDDTRSENEDFSCP